MRVKFKGLEVTQADSRTLPGCSMSDFKLKYLKFFYKRPAFQNKSFQFLIGCYQDFWDFQNKGPFNFKKLIRSKIFLSFINFPRKKIPERKSQVLLPVSQTFRPGHAVTYRSRLVISAQSR